MQRRAIGSFNDLDTTRDFEAAAGTGKTTALVSRIVSVIASGRTTLDRSSRSPSPRRLPVS